MTPDYWVDCTPWLALVVGNSRLHWGAFRGTQWIGSWHTPHLTVAQGQTLMAHGFADPAWDLLALDGAGLERPRLPWGATPPKLWMASVARPQAALWLAYPHCHPVTTDQVPLGQGYRTLGVDRALALVGAGVTYGWPVLVIDGGTALTLTAGAQGQLVGGAILPGLRSQFRALHDYTDGLPLVAPDLTVLPPRWATTTPEAMASGVWYSQLAGLREFITDWWQHYGPGPVLFTGGDGSTLATALGAAHPAWAPWLRDDPDLMFWGLRVCRQSDGEGGGRS